MQRAAERAYFLLCRVLGRLLRSARYSKTRIDDQNGEREVRKSRGFYAPLLVWMGYPLVRILNTGVRVLPQRDWEKRERQLYESMFGSAIRIDGGEMRLPRLSGKTLARLLDDPSLSRPARKTAIELAVESLSDFHAKGFTHGDAMAENVLIDLDAGVANWFDFETIHDPGRSIAWRRSDDVRALIATSLLRTSPSELEETLQLILDVYGDEEVSRLVGSSFGSVYQRPLTFHLGQAALSFEYFREIDRLLRRRIAESQTRASAAGRY